MINTTEDRMLMEAGGWQICARTDDRLGESILWHPTERALYWIDYYGPYVHRQKQPCGPVERWKIDRGEIIGSLVFASGGMLLLAVDHGLYVFDPDTGRTRFFADPKGGKMHLAYNDGKVDRAGRYWVGTLNIDETGENSAFYRVSADGQATVADDGFAICNGPAFSPDNRRLYFSDSVGRRILAYDLDRDGGVSGPRTLFSFSAKDGMPDGITVDASGHVWCALYGGGKVVRIDETGTLRETLYIPAVFVTSLCLGGPDLKTLFVTSGRSDGTHKNKVPDLGGAVFKRHVTVEGLSEPIAAI